MQERSGRNIWPCLNVAALRRERSDRSIHQTCNCFQRTHLVDHLDQPTVDSFVDHVPGAKWLVTKCPCNGRNIGLEFDDKQLRISIGLCLGSNSFVTQTYHCGKKHRTGRFTRSFYNSLSR